MRVLVVVASKHGSTREIAERIHARLRARGHDARLARPEEDPRAGDHDAVVVGSAVYMGRWMAEARSFVERHRTDLAARPVWLFSSGPLGDPPFPQEESPESVELATLVGAREHVVFAGALDKSKLGFGERAVVAALRAPTGDFRDWGAIEAWTDRIAEALVATPA